MDRIRDGINSVFRVPGENDNVVLSKVTLVGALRKKEVAVGTMRIRSKKLRDMNTEKDMLGSRMGWR